jgi:hypothetical protein
MSDYNDIAKSIRKLADTEDEVYCITAKVISVDENNRTCCAEPSNGKAQLQDIRLQSTPGGNVGLCLIPEVGTYVLIGFITKNEAVVLLAEKLTKILCSVDLIEFNGGELGGMVKLLSNVSRLNILENDLNTIKTAFNSWVPVPNDGGAALKTAATTWSSNSLTNTVRADLENEKIKQ